MKNLLILIDILNEEIKTNTTAPKFKVDGRVELLNTDFRKGYTESLSREILFIDSVLKTKRWTCKVKILNGEKIIGSFYGKGLLLRMC